MVINYPCSLVFSDARLSWQQCKQPDHSHGHEQLRQWCKVGDSAHFCQKFSFSFNPKTVFWTNVGKIVLIYFQKNTSLI